MRRDEVQQKFPDELVVFEVTEAHSEDGFRCVESVTIIDQHEDSIE
jgi:hypothetical protein